MNKKIILIIMILIICTSFVLASEKTIHEIKETKVTCQGCTSLDYPTISNQICGEKGCTIRLFKNDKELAKLELLNVEISFDQRTGYPLKILGLKDNSKQNINDFIFVMALSDEINFFQNKINNFKIKFKSKPLKESDGTLKPKEICAEKFEALGSDVRHGIERFSSFDILSKKEDNELICEITYYKIFNIKDSKEKSETIYNYKCGDISYNAIGLGLNGINCLPKIEHTTDDIRKNESKLYCHSADSYCKQSYFWFDVYGTTNPNPLMVFLEGIPKNLASDTNFQELKTYNKKTNSKNIIKTYELTTNKFKVGQLKLNPKSNKIYFYELNKPTIHFPQGVSFEETILQTEVLFNFLPEVTGPSTGKQFEGYFFWFGNPITQMPTIIFPKNMETGKKVQVQQTQTTKFYGLDIRAKYSGGYYQTKLTNGQTVRLPRKITLEFRVDGNHLQGNSKGSSVETKVSEDGSVEATKKCTEFLIETATKKEHISNFIIRRLFGKDIKWNNLNQEQKKQVQEGMTALIKLNQKGQAIINQDWKDYKANVEIENNNKKINRVWAQEKGDSIHIGDKFKIPCELTSTKGKVTIKTNSKETTQKITKRKTQNTKNSLIEKYKDSDGIPRICQENTGNIFIIEKNKWGFIEMQNKNCEIGCIKYKAGITTCAYEDVEYKNIKTLNCNIYAGYNKIKNKCVQTGLDEYP